MAKSRSARAADPAADPRWLLLVHQLPARPTSLRVRVWRRLQQVGALAVKQAVYALPNTPAAREDFEWLKTEIDGAGGEASVFAAETVDSWAGDALVEAFRRARDNDYAALARDVDAELRRFQLRRRAGTALKSRSLAQLRERLAAIEHIDFFASAGRDRVVMLVQQLGELARGTSGAVTADARVDYAGRTWVTRPRPGVDRMASAWLIRRFVDPKARFAFASDRGQVAAGALPFDMFGVTFTHRGDRCTFEVLCDDFGVSDASLARLASIVHQLDLKDAGRAAPETAAIGLIIEGLRLSHDDDAELLAAGMTLFEALYLAFKRTQTTRGPRAVARRRGSRR